MVLGDGVLSWEKTAGGGTDLMVEVRNSGFCSDQVKFKY